MLRWSQPQWILKDDVIVEQRHGQRHDGLTFEKTFNTALPIPHADGESGGVDDFGNSFGNTPFCWV